METFTDYPNVHAMLKGTVDRCGEQPAFKWFADEGRPDEVSWRDFYRELRQVAAGLMTLGIGKGDKINILSYSSYRWVLTDLAAVSIGAVSVGIYQSLLAEDCRYIIDHSDAKVVFVQDAAQLAKVEQVRADLGAVQKVVMLSGEPPADDWVLSFEAFLALGEGVPAADVDALIAGVTADDLAALVYTSGTTGVPKGAMLTHDNITFTAQSVEKSVVWQPGDQVFLFLPLAHVFARTCVYTTVIAGCTTIFARGIDTIADDLKAARPHWFPSVPRIFEKVHGKILGGVEAKGGVARKLFYWALGVGLAVGECKLEKTPVSGWLNFQYGLAQKLVFGKIQAALGGRVRWCISGAAPLNPDVGRFFHAAGVLIVEGIGMTENTSFSHLNRYDNYRFGWVGKPGPGIEHSTDADGEVLIRGRNVMKGYYKMPEDTAEAITGDGWLRTGDLGEIDDEDFLRITGRKKELIVTSGGKNVAPAPIEGMLTTSSYIGQAFVIGDRRKYLTALVTLDPENVATFAAQQGIEAADPAALTAHPRIVELIDTEVTRINAKLPSFETVKKVTIVDEFTIENGLLTPTMKLKKNIAQKRFKDQIDAMYPDD